MHVNLSAVAIAGVCGSASKLASRVISVLSPSRQFRTRTHHTTDQVWSHARTVYASARRMRKAAELGLVITDSCAVGVCHVCSSQTASLDPTACVLALGVLEACVPSHPGLLHTLLHPAPDAHTGKLKLCSSEAAHLLTCDARSSWLLAFETAHTKKRYPN